MSVDAVNVHLVTAETAHLLERVAPDVFDHAVRPELLAEFLANPMNHLVVAVADGSVIGMATAISCVHPDKPRQLFVNEVGVAGPYRRAGVGRRLVEAWVATETSNAPARALYRATGGQEDAELAVVYVYPLAPTR